MDSLIVIISVKHFLFIVKFLRWLAKLLPYIFQPDSSKRNSNVETFPVKIIFCRCFLVLWYSTVL
jgi:hypothetical protein